MLQYERFLRYRRGILRCWKLRSRLRYLRPGRHFIVIIIVNYDVCLQASASSIMMSSTTSSSSSSSIMAAPTATPSYACPGVNGQTVTDQSGTQFVIGCGSDTTSGTYAQQAAANSWNDCFAACESASTTQGAGRCSAFTYLGGANGVGSGTCFLKASTAESFSSTGGSVDLVGAIVLQYYVPISSMSPSPSSTAPSSSTQVPVTTTTTSTTRTTTTTTTSTSPVVTTTTPSSTSYPATITTTPSSTVASSSSSSAYLVLSSPTACSFGDPPGTDEDDSYCEIDLPFSMRMYGQLDNHSFPSTNGLLSIQYGSSQYQAETLPDENIPNNTVCPFFDDLYLYGTSSPQQGIFYQFNTANTAVTYEYYLARAGTAGQIYHFTVFYDSTQPGIFTITYYSTGINDNGEYASVGIQGCKFNIRRMTRTKRTARMLTILVICRPRHGTAGGLSVLVPERRHHAGAFDRLQHPHKYLHCVEFVDDGNRMEAFRLQKADRHAT